MNASGAAVNGALLVGGPSDGKTIAVAATTNVISTVFMLPLPVFTQTPRPRWWRHPVRFLRWKPEPLPEIPEPVQLRYAADGTTDEGRRVFRLTSPWQPWRSPEVYRPDDGNLYEGLVTVLYAAHPAIRQDPATRWVMSEDWWNQIRREAVTGGYPDDDPDPKPSPEDRLLETPISVAEDGGAPHLENQRYPQGWPGTP